MKLVSFSSSGRSSYGVVTDDKIVDVGRIHASRYPTLRAALAAGALSEMQRMSENQKPDLLLSEVALLPPIPEPEKIVCIGLNYKAHVLEAGRKLPTHPTLFLRLIN